MTYSNALTSHYLALAKQPISPGNFAGEDCRFSPEYEALESELGKAASLHHAGTVDWQRVASGAEAIIAQQAKDLRAAAWLTWGLYQRESFAGLHAGIALLAELCEQRWSDLHPRKPRTRAAALVWLVPRLDQAIGEQVPVAEQLALFTSLANLLHRLDHCLTEHLADESPLLLPLCRRLDEMVSRAGKGQPDVGAVGTAIAQVKQVATQVLTGNVPIGSEKDAQKALRALQEQSRPLATWWLKQKATDLKALRLCRTLLWLGIDSLPERSAEHITALRGLPADKLASLKERFAQGAFADLLAELEASLARAPFWLDGQRLAWECLQALDAPQAMREVEIQLALFLQRVPGLEELRFHDGVPFADAQTRAWIAGQVLPHLQLPETRRDSSPAATDQVPAWDRALDEALPLLRKDGLKAAVQQLKTGLAGAQGGRERFHWQLALARLCMQAKKYDLAKTQLESLDQTLTATGLGDWEPDLALEVLRLLHHCCEVLPQNHAVRESKDEIYRRLCHLDLEVVLD